MKNNWIQSDFSDCIDSITYTKKIQRSNFLSSGKHPIISQEAEFINGYWDKDADLYKIDSPVVIFGDHTQVLKYVDFDFVLGADGVKVLKAKPFLDPKYLFYYLQSMHIKNLGYARHYRLLKEIKVNYPTSITEQKRISSLVGSVLDDAVKAKENTEKNLQYSQDLFESYLQNVFSNPDKSWIRCPLGEHVKFIDYRGKTPKKTHEGLRLITAKNVKMGYIQKEPEEFVNPTIYDKWMTRGIPQVGDVLFTTEAPLANVAQLNTSDKVVFAQRIIVLQPNPQVLSQDFLKYLLLSKPLQKVILLKGTGATVKGIKASLLKGVEIYFPNNVSEQEVIVSKLNDLSRHIEHLKDIYEGKIDTLSTLKKSVLNKAFSGEL